MDHVTAALLIPVAVSVAWTASIVMGGLVKIAREFSRGRRHPEASSLEARMDALEHELRAVRGISARPRSGWILLSVSWLSRGSASTSAPQNEELLVRGHPRACSRQASGRAPALIRK